MGSLKSAGRDTFNSGERIAFVTGKLAAPALSDTVERLSTSERFDYEIIVLNIAVAALMTTEWIAKRLKVPSGITRLVLPGYVRGELAVVEQLTGCTVERGPKDLRVLAQHFGKHSAETDDYGAFDIEVIAEINHVPELTSDEILRVANRYRDHGADIIDLGCNPGATYGGIGEVVRLLRSEGHRVSVDSLDPAEIRLAGDAGVELVLSVTESNLEVARDLNCEVVVIPDQPSGLVGLESSVERLEEWNVPYRIDPVIEPIGFGFAKSMGRYLQVRELYPDAEIMMGVGNLTELTDADTAAMNVLLLGFCQEIGIRSVLTTEVVHWAQSCVRELDLARRLVHYAVCKGTLPKHREPNLHLLRDESTYDYGDKTLRQLASELKDRNFRIFVDQGRIHLMNRELHLDGEDPFELFDELSIDDSSHAFYLGYEMAKAVTAITLGKRYTQDEALRWGFLTRDEESHLERRGHREP
ncbi:MAG: DUF6513 domain-containing protein [Planctomycetes bacterium]|nr:DUF6513 domain-containing protein [Planctomycetota bacterium]